MSKEKSSVHASWKGSEPEYSIAVFKDIMVPMRDGIRLAADVYCPVKNGKLVEAPLPTILVRTPYGKYSEESNGEYFAKRGYIVVIQDVRGRFNSEGDFIFMANEGLDGYDTVEWIALQPWSNGKVGTMGTSYMSWVQSALSLHNPPHLTTLFPNQSGWNGAISSIRHAGAMEMRIFVYAFRMAAYSKEAEADPLIAEALSNVRIGQLLTRYPLKRGQTPLRLVPVYEKWAFDLITHADYDDFWKKVGKGWMGNVEMFVDQHADVPTYYSGAWYDSYTGSTPEFYRVLSEKKNEAIKLIMGPWTHGDAAVLARSYSGDVDFGPAAGIEYNILRLRWFDHWLKDIDTGIMDEPPIRIFVMGGGDGKKNKDGRLNHGGHWRYENEWPLARTQFTEYYLKGDKTLSIDPPTESASSTSYIYDPENPVPTIGGNLSAIHELLPVPEEYEMLKAIPLLRRIPLMRRMIVKGGAQNQVEGGNIYGCKPPYLPLSSRRDVLVFQTPPLEGAIEVTGPITVNLWSSSSAVDTDFTAKLIDVYPPNEDYPDGYAMILSDSIIHARYRNSFEKAELMTPGAIYKFTIKPYPTCNIFVAGHRIRLDVSSSNWPRFDINPNTGEPLALNNRMVKAENTVYHDVAHPSHVVIPVIPIEK